ncbi:MAG: LPS export ABC transporter periplasmic protein LptC [Bacteroidales bacterium]
MKGMPSKFRFYSAITGLIFLSMITLSCENKIAVIPKSDFLTNPSLTGKNIRTILSDSGRVQLIMTSPLIEKYDKADPQYTEFRYGIRVVVYNSQKDSVIVTSKYAKCTNNNLWELRDSVVVINENNEKLETELLYWNQEKDRIYSDRFVKMTSEDVVSQGIGFESDSHLNKRRIFKENAIIYVKGEK